MAASLLSPEPLNINISAYRVLYILLMLVRYRNLNLIELNRHLMESPLIGKAYDNETLSKYINTLRELGCQIPRASSKNDYCYELVKNPFPLLLEDEEAEVASKLLSLLNNQPDEALASEYRHFLEELTWSVHLPSLLTDTQTSQPTHQKTETLPFPALARRRQLLKQYREYCRDAFKLHIQYRHASSNTVQHIYLEPQDARDQGNQLILLGLDCDTYAPISLNIECIEAIEQLPSKNSRPNIPTTVTFALYGRLAKSYRLYPDERIVYQKEAEIHIKTKVLDTDALLNRLMKYGVSCQILGPDKLRESIRERITALLTHFQHSG